MKPVIVGMARTPFVKFGGPLRDHALADLGAHAVGAALSRARVTPAEVGEVVMGVNLPGSDRSVARQIALAAGTPATTNAMTVDRACCSSLAALTVAERGLASRSYNCAVVGGAENLSRVPYFLEDLRWGKQLGDITLSDQLVISCPYTGVPRAVQASQEAAGFGIGRREQDEWAVRSQSRYAEAVRSGYPKAEIEPIEADGNVLDGDVGPRPETTLADLSALPTVNGSASITAGNAPGLSTGATAMIVMNRRVAEERELDVLAEVVATAQTSGPPENIASAPAHAAWAALHAAESELDDMASIEINEAFAAVPLVSTYLLAGEDQAQAVRLRDRVNEDGGAIAVGHPTGATAVRLVMTTVERLKRRGGGLGLVSICGGIGEAASAVIRVED